MVLGANDAIGDSANGFWNRYYVAMTKHIVFENIGTLGTHLSWIYSNRFDNKLNDPAVGANFRFHLRENLTFNPEGANIR